MTTTEQLGDTTLVSVGGGAGMIEWRVLRWWVAVERVVGRFRVDGERVLSDPALPPTGQEFVDAHADELRRLVLATPARVM